MKARNRDPQRLDVEAFAKDGDELAGQWPLSALDRLCESAHPEARPGDADAVDWQARGELRPVRGGPAQVWLHVGAQARIQLECQRCLQPVGAELQAQRSFQFAPDEATAAEIDADSEDDVLVLTRALDLKELVEDELILALPLVPRHDDCPQPLVAPEAVDEPLEERPNPFAALAVLKGKPSH
ncbi:MAG: DUF177 domain-containing protein [Piscinibacter sp.]